MQRTAISKKEPPPKVLVLTLFCGEAEYETCKRSVSEQKHVLTEHVCFEWLENRKAHEALYRTIMEKRSNFDAFVKLDADMVFSNPSALSELLYLMDVVPGTDHLSIPVYDLPSASYLMGVHIFSPRAFWRFPLDPLFPDRHPEVPGFQRIEFRLQIRLVEHMPNPSERQAFLLGVHRASKVSLKDYNNPEKTADFPLSYLKRIAVNRAFDARKRRIIITGMFMALLNPSIGQSYKIKKMNEVETSRTAIFLSFLYDHPIMVDIIFQFLRVRYVYWRRMKRLFCSKFSTSSDL